MKPLNQPKMEMLSSDLYRSHAPRGNAATPPARSADNHLSSDGTTSHSTKLANNASQVAGYVLCLQSSERGISLIELIMFIVIVSVALAGVMLVMNTTTKYSADPLIHKQALTVAESLLEEIELKYFAITANVAGRQNFNDIFDYNALNPASATYANSSVAVAGLESYSVTVAVVSGVTLTGVLAASAAQITVTVTEPGGQAIEVTGYKVAY